MSRHAAPDGAQQRRAIDVYKHPAPNGTPQTGSEGQTLITACTDKQAAAIAGFSANISTSFGSPRRSQQSAIWFNQTAMISPTC